MNHSLAGEAVGGSKGPSSERRILQSSSETSSHWSRSLQAERLFAVLEPAQARLHEGEDSTGLMMT